jgi:hypothetical protein
LQLLTIKISFHSAILALMLALALPAQASIIEVAFSGTIEVDQFDIPIGTIISAGFSYDTDATTDFVINKDKFPVFDIFLSMMGQTVTNNFGYLAVYDDNLNFQSGPALSSGGNTPFSDFINGIEIRGVGFTLNGVFSSDTLPTDVSEIYGQFGTFFVNRSRGTLFDVNSPDLLNIPIAPTTPDTSVPEPNAWLFVVGLLAVWCSVRRLNYWCQ